MAYMTKKRQGALGSYLKGAVRRNRLHQDGSCLRQSVSADMALSEKSPYLGGDRVRWVFWATRM